MDKKDERIKELEAEVKKLREQIKQFKKPEDKTKKDTIDITEEMKKQNKIMKELW